MPRKPQDSRGVGRGVLEGFLEEEEEQNQQSQCKGSQGLKGSKSSSVWNKGN